MSTTNKRKIMIIISGIIILIGLYFVYIHYCKIVDNTIKNVQQEIEQVKQETTQKVETIKQSIKAVQSEAKKVGDTRVKEIQSADDNSFLEQLNNYSDIMEQRTKSVD